MFEVYGFQFVGTQWPVGVVEPIVSYRIPSSQTQREQRMSERKENHVSTCGIDFLRHSKRPTPDWRERRNNPSCKYRKKPYFSFFARRVGVGGGCDGI